MIKYQNMQNVMGNSKIVVKNCKSDFSINVNVDESEKLVYFNTKTVVFQNSVYWVHLAGDLIFGFQASPDIN